MIYLPAIVAVGYYFESKRAVATGIAVAGSGVGTIILPMVCEYFVKGNEILFIVSLFALVFILNLQSLVGSTLSGYWL